MMTSKVSLLSRPILGVTRVSRRHPYCAIPHPGGLLLLGGCFISVGLLISSLTKNQIVAAVVTFAVFLMLWVINWIGTFVGPTTQSVLNQLSLTDHFDDFSRGVIDTKHLVFYVSFICLGLFLTAKSVDTERWRG